MNSELTPEPFIKSPSRKIPKNELQAYKNTLQLTQEQKEIIVGTLLGDSSMSLRQNKPHYSIKFEQKSLSKGYVYHLYDIFKPFVGTGPSERWIQKEEGRKAIWFRTYQHDQFIFYYNLFYSHIDGKLQAKKIVPKNIGNYLTERGLAYWFMDDGTCWVQNSTTKKVNYIFNTHGFEKHECNLLAEVLRKKFEIKCTVVKDKTYFRIYVLIESTERLRELMEPYIHETFKYKLNGDKAPL